MPVKFEFLAVIMSHVVSITRGSRESGGPTRGAARAIFTGHVTIPVQYSVLSVRLRRCESCGMVRLVTHLNSQESRLAPV